MIIATSLEREHSLPSPANDIEVTSGVRPAALPVDRLEVALLEHAELRALVGTPSQLQVEDARDLPTVDWHRRIAHLLERHLDEGWGDVLDVRGCDLVPRSSQSIMGALCVSTPPDAPRLELPADRATRGVKLVVHAKGFLDATVGERLSCRPTLTPNGDVSSEALGLPLFALRDAATLLIAIDADVRAALLSAPRALFETDRAGRMVRCALMTLSVATPVTNRTRTLSELVVAAMVQELLDDEPHIEGARQRLLDALECDASARHEVVVAYEATCIRRCVETSCATAPTLHARLVALICEEARPSLVDERGAAAIEVPVEIELPSDALEDRDSFEDAQRVSIDLPSHAAADGRSTLALTSLAQILVATRNRKLTGTMVLHGVEGDRHAVVFERGEPVHARTRAYAPPLGEVLRDLDLVDPQVIPRSVALAAVAGIPLGVQLVREGTLDPAQLDEALVVQLVARIGALGALPPATQVEFFAHCDLLRGRTDRPVIPAAPEAAVLAVSRRSEPSRLRSVVQRLGDGLVAIHTGSLDRLRANVAEKTVVGHVLDVQRRARGVELSALIGDSVALPLLATLLHLGEAHAVTSRPCRRCREEMG